MAVFSTDFSEYAVGSPPTGWTALGAATWNIVEDLGALGEKKLVGNSTLSTNSFLLVDALSGISDFEALVLFAPVNQGGVAGRISGAIGSENAFVAKRNGSGAIVARYTAGAASSGGFINVTNAGWAASPLFWIRLRASGANVDYKVWAVLDAEPASFTSAFTDAFVTAGSIGLPARLVTQPEYQYLSVGTGGDLPVFPSSGPEPLPDAPNHTVCVATNVEMTTATLTGAAYVHQDLLAHKDSRWQIRDVNGPEGWGTLVFDSGWDAVNLTTIDVTGLPSGTSLEAQVIYRGTNDVESGVEDTAFFVTMIDGTLVRIHEGLLFRDQFDRAGGLPGNGWTGAKYYSAPSETVPSTYPDDPYESGFDGGLATYDVICNLSGAIKRAGLGGSVNIVDGVLVITALNSSDNSDIPCAAMDNPDPPPEEIITHPPHSRFVFPIYNTTIGPLREYVVQAELKGSVHSDENFRLMYVMARIVPRTAPDTRGQYLDFPTLGTDTHIFGTAPGSNLHHLRVARSAQDSPFSVGQMPSGFSHYQAPYPNPEIVNDEWVRQKAWVEQGRMRTYARGKFSGDLNDVIDTDDGGPSAAILNDTDAGYAGLCAIICNLGSSFPAAVRDFSIYSSNVVTVTGLPAGYSIRAMFPASSGWPNAIKTALVYEVAGIAEVDIGGCMCPDVRLEVLDNLDRSVGIYTGHEGNVWGGDVYDLEYVVSTPTVDIPLEKAWAFTLDGHVFYVLNTIEDETIVCDLTTGQWHQWQTGEYTFWNMFRGVMWRGRVLGADHTAGVIWELDPHSSLDEETTEIERMVTGFQSVRGRESYRQGSLRLTASVGAPSASPASVQMRFSDDGGNTWSGYYSVTLVDEDYDQPIEWRSLGRVRAPGRLWEITDEGGLVRIEGLDSDMEAPG